MTKKISSKNIGERFLAGLAKTPAKEQDQFLQAFVNWLYVKRFWRRRQEIFTAIKKGWYNEQGLAEANITTSADLPAETKQDLLKALEKQLGKKILPNFQTKPDLLGGIRIEMDGAVLTFTFQQLLNNLRH